MRIDVLRLEEWGSFHDVDVELGPGLVVLHGPNEAGKSTLQRALTSLLFGIPARSVQDAWRVGDRKKLRLGGRLTFADGTELDVRRTHHRAPNDVRGADDELLPEAARRQFDTVVSGLDAATYERRFALDHARLRAGGDELAQAEGSLGETLFAAATGIADLRAVLGGLREDRDRYYNGLRKGRIHADAAQFKEAHAALVRDRADVDRLAELRARDARLRASLESAVAELASAAEQRAELERVQAARPFHAEWLELQERRAAAGAEPALTPTDAARVEPVLLAYARDLAAREGHEARLARMDVEAADLRAGAQLAPLAERAAGLARAIGGLQAAERQAADATAELQRARDARAGCEQPDPDHAARLSAALASARDADHASVTRLASALHASSDAIASLEAELSAIDPLPSHAAVPSIDATREAASRISRATERAAASVEAYAAAQAETADAAAALEALGANVADAMPSGATLHAERSRRDEAWSVVAAGWRAGDPFHDASITAATESTHAADRIADSLVQDASLAEQVRSTRIQHAQAVARESTSLARLEADRAALAAIESEWELCVRAAGLPPASPEASLPTITQLHELHARRGEQATARTQLTRACDQLEQLVSPLRALLDGADAPGAVSTPGGDPHDRATALVTHARELIERGELRLRTLADAGTALQRWDERIESAERQLLDAERTRADFVATTAQVAHDAVALDPTLADAVAELTADRAAAVATLLDQRAREAHGHARQLAQLEASRLEARAAIDTVSAQVVAHDVEVRALFEAAGLQVPPDLTAPGVLAPLESAARDALAWGRLDADDRSLLDRLRSAAGDATRPADTFALVERLDAAEVATRLHALEESMREREEQRITDDRERDQVQRDIGVIEQSDVRSELLTAREAARGRIVQDTERWLPLQLGEQLLAEAIETWRAQNQSPVLARASDYFRTLTGGAYVQLRGDEESGSGRLVAIPAADDPREQVELGELSEGTRDQLYLALRLGSIDEQLAHRSEPLPLVLDDVLVTSDAGRVRAALAALAQVGATTQVLLLTHSELVRDIAAELSATAACSVVELAGVAVAD